MTSTLHTPPWPPETRYLHTGGLIVDLCYRRLLHPEARELPQRLFDLLLVLMAKPNALHTRAELFEQLWAGLVVEDASLTQNVWLLRKALGEERKHWIQTVAKGGYVFAPPGPIDAWMALPDSQGVVDSDALEEGGPQLQPETSPETEDTRADEPEAAPEPAAAKSTRRPRARRWLSVAAALTGVVLVGVMAIRMAPQSRTSATPHTPITVALVTVADPGNAAQWPATLMYEWVKWKLDQLPEVTLLNEADLAAGIGSTPTEVVFLSSAEVRDRPGKIVLRARFQRAGREQRIEQEGDPAKVAAMVDAMSQRILRELTPARAAQPWPRLELTEPAARRYAAAADAWTRRNWMEAASALDEVVQLAPHFGLARAQLAFAQSRLSQRTLAMRNMDAALALLKPAPAEVTEVLTAQRLSLDPVHSENTASAYGKLAARHPGKASFALAYASQLVRSDRPVDALPLLVKLNHEAAPIGTRIARLLALSDAHRALGDSESMLRNAQAAELLARKAGSGWEQERAAALAMQAQARYHLSGHIDTRLFEEAAKLLEQVGNHTGALYVRFRAKAMGPTPSIPDPDLDRLLAEANAGGDRGLELSILFLLAQRSQNAGDLDGYRKRMEEAESIALVSGDRPGRARIDTLMIYDDYLRAHLARLDARAQRLRQGPMQGALAVLVDELRAAASAARGNAKAAVERLQHAEQTIPTTLRGEELTVTQARLACSMAEARLPTGDLAGTREDIRRCAAAKDQASRIRLLLSHADIDRLAGDRVSALANVRRAQGLLTDYPDDIGKSGLVISTARLLTRLGASTDSDALLAPLPAKIRPTGYTLLLSLTETGLAENAAARGDWNTSRRHADAARVGIPTDLWCVTSRLDQLEAAASLAAGDRSQAIALAKRLHDQAHALGDAEVQVELHSLLPEAFPDELRAAREMLVARTGMRGAKRSWLPTPR